MGWKSMIKAHGMRLKLSGCEYRVLMVLAEHAGADGGNAWPAIQTIADESEANRSTVKRALRTLESAGAIQRIRPATNKQPATWRIVWGCNLTRQGVQNEPSRGCILPSLRVQNAPQTCPVEPVHEPVHEPVTLAAAREPTPLAKAASMKTDTTAKRTRLSEDWQPSADDREFAESRGVNIEAEALKFVCHHVAKGTLMANWHRAWMTWCLNAVSYGQASGQRNLPILAVIQGTGPAPGDDQSDAYGARGWASKTPGTELGTIRGAKVPCLEGFDLGGTAHDACIAAGLPATWRGDLSAVGDWLRSGIEPDAIVDAIRRARKPQGELKSLRWFDGFVRQQATRAAG